MALFLRAHQRKKNGKSYTCWSITESVRTAANKVVQRHVLYLGALTAVQEQGWTRTIERFAPPPVHPELPGLAVATRREITPAQAAATGVHLEQVRVEQPRQWGACWVAIKLWHLLALIGVLVALAATQSRRHGLAACAHDPGHLPPHRSRQQMAVAPAVVRKFRSRRPAG